MNSGAQVLGAISGIQPGLVDLDVISKRRDLRTLQMEDLIGDIDSD